MVGDLLSKVPNGTTLMQSLIYLALAGLLAGNFLVEVPSNVAPTAVPSASFNRKVTKHTERIVIKGGSLVETITTEVAFTRVKE